MEVNAVYTGLVKVNLGTGLGYSAFQMVNVFEKTSGKSVPYDIVARLRLIIVQCYADLRYVYRLLPW